MCVTYTRNFGHLRSFVFSSEIIVQDTTLREHTFGYKSFSLIYKSSPLMCGSWQSWPGPQALPSTNLILAGYLASWFLVRNALRKSTDSRWILVLSVRVEESGPSVYSRHTVDGLHSSQWCWRPAPVQTGLWLNSERYMVPVSHWKHNSGINILSEDTLACSLELWLHLQSFWFAASLLLPHWPCSKKLAWLFTCSGW